MEIKEIIFLILLTCITILMFPYILKLSSSIADNFYDELKDWVVDTVTSYKEDWKDCIKTVKGWLFNG